MSGPIQSSSSMNAGLSQLQRLQAQRAQQSQYASKPKSTSEIQDFAALTVESIMQELHAPQAAPPEPKSDDFFNDLDVQSIAQSSAPQRTSNRAESPVDRLPVDDIRSVAERAGFVGISDRDIRRAYAMGESLLADYRV